MADLNISSADLIPYSLPLSDGSSQRQGRLVRLQTSAGLTAWGDVAPLPGLSQETVKSVDAHWRRLQRGVTTQPWRRFKFDQPDAVDDRLTGIELPSLRFGLEQALLGLTAQALDQTPLEWLDPSGQEPVKVAGLITSQGARAVETAKALIAQGYRTLKIKVGRGSELDELRTAVAIRSLAGTDVLLRFDANRSWALDRAIRFVNQLNASAIEFLEEPLVNPKEVRTLWEATRVPIALDETLTKIQPAGLVNWSFASYLIIKPTLLGGILHGDAFVRMGLRMGMKSVVSSSYESGLGLCYLAALTTRWSLEGHAAGVDTYRGFASDVLKDRLPVAPLLKRSDLRFEPAAVEEWSQ